MKQILAEVSGFSVLGQLVLSVWTCNVTEYCGTQSTSTKGSHVFLVDRKPRARDKGQGSPYLQSLPLVLIGRSMHQNAEESGIPMTPSS